MERTPTLLVSATTSDRLDARPAPTIKCERDKCERVLPRTSARKINQRVAHSAPKEMLVCPDCFDYYLRKPSTVTRSRVSQDDSSSQANLPQIKKAVCASQRGNQSQVAPVISMKSGRPKQHRSPAAKGSRKSKSLIPTGQAPGGEDVTIPNKIPPLNITLPKELTRPLALEHYAMVRKQLGERVHAGGQRGTTVIIHGRLSTQLPGRIKAYLIASESIDNVPIRIDYENLRRLLFNAFLPNWLKSFMNYPLTLEQVSLRLQKGRGCIYLDNKEHAILEHCVSLDGNKVIKDSLDVMLLVDVEYFEEAKAHRDNVKEQVDDQEISYRGPDSEAEDIFVSRTAGPSLASHKLQITPLQVHTRDRPKPRPINKKRKILEDSQTTTEVPKRTRSSNISGSSHSPMAAPVNDIRQALIAQREPQPDDINGLLCTTSFPILFWLCPSKPLASLISAKSVTDPGSGFGDWMQEVQAQNGFILYNTSQKPQYGAFKSMLEGQIDLMGAACPFLATSATFIALKQPYLLNHSDSDLSPSVVPVPTLALSPDDQIKELAADALSIQWASSLLQDVYAFIASYHKNQQTTCPITIPQFRFVKAGLAVTNVPGVAPEKKEAFLVEELIQSTDGPWRKYINNCSSCPRHFSDPGNCRRAEFLAFCQHVQYWRTGCQAFTSDFQGGDTLLTDPQIITHPCEISFYCQFTSPDLLPSDLGRKLFSKGNVQQTHREFEKEHRCNLFCTFFEVPTSYDQLEGPPSDTENRQHGKQRVSGLHELLNPASSDDDDAALI